MVSDMRIARLSILDSYGVRWTHATFARDLLQNFFDSAADFRAVTIDVRAEQGVVEIRGPETFDLDLLAYIGATTKTSGRTVGGFGEGFKICALIGARDFGLTITAGSGAEEIAVFFDPVPLGRELCYRVTTRAEAPIAGSYVRLEGCDATTLAAFQAAPAMFRHPDNPGLREPLVVDFEQGVGVYAARGGRDGELYYRRQLRGKTRFYAARGERPLTIAHDGIIDELEGDRDRRDLPAQPIARAVGEKLAPEDLHRVLLELMPYWKYGNDVLSGLLQAGAARALRFPWPARWLAQSADGRGLAELAERQGYSIALAGFAALGMPTARDHYSSLETRAATPLERARFEVVSGLYEGLLGQPARTREMEVFDLEGSAVAGQHLGDRIIVGAQLLAGGFDAVGGTILHELAHETGGEEDLRFLRRLTNLLGAALREPEKVRVARRRYAAARPKAATPRRKPLDTAASRRPYQPEYEHGPTNDAGPICTLIVPAGFPPTTQIIAALGAAAEASGVGVWVCAAAVSGPVGAVTWQAPGLPSLFIGGVDPDPPPPDRAALGYRLRTYGPDGLALWPDHETLVAALLRAKAQGIVGRAGLDVHSRQCDGFRERVRELLGIELPAPRTARRPTAIRERDGVLRAWVNHHLGSNGGFGLADTWTHGRQAAAEVWIRAARADRRNAETLFREIVARLQRVTEHAAEPPRRRPRLRRRRRLRAVRHAGGDGGGGLRARRPGLRHRRRGRPGSARERRSAWCARRRRACSISI